ncbi:hypothetical protein B0T22DRAFT_515658 [Podospora appendiculata]|uniref:Uncharacterized protein n=1 Tax=Podospora appendiculata TaxID=314037 RepID=A0AAE0XCZ6_9PEZI|nr:hypothetical protein B0T22DRAFT_515658 [Podospora appendiculata]
MALPTLTLAELDSVRHAVKHLRKTHGDSTVELRFGEATYCGNLAYKLKMDGFPPNFVSVRARMTPQEAAQRIVEDSDADWYFRDTLAEWVNKHGERIERFLHLISLKSATTLAEEVSDLDITNFNGDELFEDLPLKFCSYEGPAIPTDPQLFHQLKPCAPFMHDDPPELLRLKRIRIVMFFAFIIAQDAYDMATLLLGLPENAEIYDSVERASVKRARKLHQHVLVGFGVRLIHGLVRHLSHVKKRLYDPKDKDKWTDAEGYIIREAKK